MSITITGKNLFIEQLLAEELTKKGFKVQSLNEGLFKIAVPYDRSNKNSSSGDEAIQARAIKFGLTCSKSPNQGGGGNDEYIFVGPKDKLLKFYYDYNKNSMDKEEAKEEFDEFVSKA